jgi:hypothetical protein
MANQMTDEELQKLIATLRWYGDRMELALSSPMRAAADELVRLAKEVKRLQNVMADPYRDGINTRKVDNKMTDDERQELCAYLRRCAEQEYHDAADEIERLQAQAFEERRSAFEAGMRYGSSFRQSNAEPVAWIDLDQELNFLLDARVNADDAGAAADRIRKAFKALVAK